MSDEPAEENELDIESWEIRAQFYSCVGQAISMWSSMEDQLVQLAASLLGTTEEKTGLLLYSMMNFHGWLNVIDELLVLAKVDDNTKELWADISGKLRKLNDIRVRLAHHTVWNPAMGAQFGLLPGSHDARSKSRKQGILTGPQIVQFTNDVRTAESDLRKLVLVMAMNSASAGPQDD